MVESTMEEFGHILKEAREGQNFSLEDLASLTRIQEHYLQALEEDRFEELPQQVFTKGFVRTYARALNMDKADVMRRFTVASGSHYQHEEEEQEHAKQQIVESRKGKANRNAVVILTGLVLIGLLFILPTEQSIPPPPNDHSSTGSNALPVSEGTTGVENLPPVSAEKPTQTKGTEGPSGPKEESKVKGADPKKAESKPVSKPVAAVTTPSSQPSPSLKPKEATPAPAVVASVQEPADEESVSASAGDAEMMTMSLEALEITWVVVSSDEGESQEALLQPGETAQWKANDHFVVTLGNAGGVNVKIDGKPRGPFGPAGTVVRDLMIRR